MMLGLALFLLALPVKGALCNGTSNETPTPAFALQVSHSTNSIGRIYELIVTIDAFYLSID